MKRLLPCSSAAVMGLAALLLLSACAAPGSAPSAQREIKTESDSSVEDRRAGIRLELAQGYFSRGQYNTALDELKLALQAKPEMREAVNLRGLIYAAMGEPQLAEEAFQRALNVYPKDADTLHNYAWFKCQQQNWQTADALFDQALAQPTYRAPSRTLLAKGVCQARAQHMQAAEKTLTRAFELDAANPAIAFNLAEVLFRNGEKSRALFYIKQVNDKPDLVSAQSLWLQLRVERSLGNRIAQSDLEQKLRTRFPQSPEVSALDAGRFDS